MSGPVRSVAGELLIESVEYEAPELARFEGAVRSTSGGGVDRVGGDRAAPLRAPFVFGDTAVDSAKDHDDVGLLGTGPLSETVVVASRARCCSYCDVIGHRFESCQLRMLPMREQWGVFESRGLTREQFIVRFLHMREEPPCR